MRRSRHKTLEFIEIISIIAVILFVLLYFTGLISCVPQNVKDTNQEVENNAGNINDLNDRVDTVDKEVTALKKELDKTRTEFMFSINQLYIADEQFQNDKAIIENYLNTLSTKEELNTAISNIETGIVNGDYVSSVMHANVFRGKYLGNTLTETQLSAIRNGTFDELFVGDYWLSDSGVHYRIADINYYLNTQKNMNGDMVTTPHLVIVPDESLYSSTISDTDSLSSGFIGSKLFSLNNAKSIINETFNGNYVSWLGSFSYSVDNNGNTNDDYRNVWCSLLSENLTYGSNLITKARSSVDDRQLALFRLNAQYIYSSISYWLRDAVNNKSFASINKGVHRVCPFNIQGERGVRPYFCIG